MSVSTDLLPTVVRDGAAVRTADDLCVVFLHDTADVLDSFAEIRAGEGGYYTLADRFGLSGETVGRDADRVRVWAEGWQSRLDSFRSVYGTAWLDDADDSVALREDVSSADSMLGDCGFLVDWEDGYTIRPSAVLLASVAIGRPMSEGGDFDCGWTRTMADGTLRVLTDADDFDCLTFGMYRCEGGEWVGDADAMPAHSAIAAFLAE